MLIDFTVANYRSIKEAVTLSTIAQTGRTPGVSAKRSYRVKPDDEIATPFPIRSKGFELLPAVGIFGANASGKSNILRALDDFLHLMEFGHQDDKGDLTYLSNIVPFNLDKTFSNKPSEFCIRVARDETIFIYEIKLNQEQIISEKFSYIPKDATRKIMRNIFSRQLRDDGISYDWSTSASLGSGYRSLMETIRPHVPFISIIIRMLQIPIVESFARWVRLRWLGAYLGEEDLDFRSAVSSLNKDYWSAYLPAIINALKLFDTGIQDIEFEKIGDEKYRVFSIHRTLDGLIRMPFEEESMGTQRLFALVYYIVRAFRFETILLVDELGANIHPNITREIVRMFQEGVGVPKYAQIIFTSHDNTLQRNNILRRDQIWFTEKQSDESTALYPLSDFKPRNDLVLDKSYLDGRFGAVPFLPSDGHILTLAGVEEND